MAQHMTHIRNPVSAPRYAFQRANPLTIPPPGSTSTLRVGHAAHRSVSQPTCTRLNSRTGDRATGQVTGSC